MFRSTSPSILPQFSTDNSAPDADTKDVENRIQGQLTRSRSVTRQRMGTVSTDRNLARRIGQGDLFSLEDEHVRGRLIGLVQLYRQGLAVGRKREHPLVDDLPPVFFRELQRPLALTPARRNNAFGRAGDRMVMPVERHALDGALADE